MSLPGHNSGDPDMTPAPSEQALRDFYDSWQWKRFAYRVKKERGLRCEMCGATPEHGVRIVLDHIRPVRFYWHLRLTETNVQVLCDDDNRGKGSWDMTDFREPLRRPLDDIAVAILVGNRSEIKNAVTTAHSLGLLTEAEVSEYFVNHELGDA